MPEQGSDETKPPEKVSVLFCCLGNICRSTMAEGVFRSIASKPPYKDLIGRIDSCGTSGWHVGEPPDSMTMRTLEAHGITDYVHSGRQISEEDFDKFDYIFAMDKSNLSNLMALRERKKPNGKANVMLFGYFSGKEGGRKGKRKTESEQRRRKYSGMEGGEVIVDPWGMGGDRFETVYQQAVRFSDNFLKQEVLEK